MDKEIPRKRVMHIWPCISIATCNNEPHKREKHLVHRSVHRNPNSSAHKYTTHQSKELKIAGASSRYFILKRKANYYNNRKTYRTSILTFYIKYLYIEYQ